MVVALARATHHAWGSVSLRHPFHVDARAVVSRLLMALCSDNSAAVEYEGVTLLFPTLLRHRSATPPANPLDPSHRRHLICALALLSRQLLQLRNWHPDSLHRLGDAMQSIRLLASTEPSRPGYVSAENARDPFVATGVSRCTSL